MADQLIAQTEEILAGNAIDMENAQGKDQPSHAGQIAPDGGTD